MNSGRFGKYGILDMAGYRIETLDNALPEAAEMSFDVGQGTTPNRLIVLADVLFGRARQTLERHTAFYEITYAELSLAAPTPNFRAEERFGDLVNSNVISTPQTRTDSTEQAIDAELALSTAASGLSLKAGEKRNSKRAQTIQTTENSVKQRVRAKGNLKWDISEFDTGQPLRGRYIGSEPLCIITSDTEVAQLTLKVLVPKRSFVLHSVTENSSGEVKDIHRGKQKILEILSQKSIHKDGDALVVCEGRLQIGGCA